MENLSYRMGSIMGHLWIVGTLVFTIYGQLIIKWQMGKVGGLPEGVGAKVVMLLGQLLNFWIVTGFFSAFLAAMCWMAAMTRFELSYAYPFMSLAFIGILFFSFFFLGEPMTYQKIVGTVLVVGGISLIAS